MLFGNIRPTLKSADLGPMTAHRTKSPRTDAVWQHRTDIKKVVTSDRWRSNGQKALGPMPFGNINAMSVLMLVQHRSNVALLALKVLTLDQ